MTSKCSFDYTAFAVSRKVWIPLTGLNTPVDSYRLRASKFSVLKLIEIVILWVYYTIPFDFSLLRHFLVITFQLFKCIVWLRINKECSVPEMRIWSILFIKSDCIWCIHLSRSLFLYFNYFVSVTACGLKSPEGTCSQVLRSTSVDSYRLRASKFSVLKLIVIVIL